MIQSSAITPGTLIDEHGRQWQDVDFVIFTPGEATDRGHEYSLAYTARFIRRMG